ncbi:MAG: heavy metal translocating P-type ATPase [Paludibacter sp.]
MKTEKFDVHGMSCAACAGAVERSVSKLSGIKSVNVNLLTNSMNVDFDERILTPESIEKSVEMAGYEAHIRQDFTRQKATQRNTVDYAFEEQEELKRRFIFSVTFLVPLLYVSMGHMIGLPLPLFLHSSEYIFFNAFVQFCLLVPIVITNRGYFTKGMKSLFKASPNMDSLIAIGAGAAIVYGIYALSRIAYGLYYGMVHDYRNDLYFESAGTILTLVTLGKYLEARSKRRTTNAISRLLDLSPKTATVIRNRIEMDIPVGEVELNEIVVIRPGGLVPVDGIVVSGSSSVDESPLTGESMPVFKEEGDTVLSASINKSGSFNIRATKVGNNTTLAQIIQLVEEASSSKAPISKLADKISAIFVPVVILIAIFTTVAWLMVGKPFDFALSIGIAVLVISCPCALGLATPVAIMVGTGKGAEHGILIKSAEALQMGSKIDTVVLDKTGTLTEGKPRITHIFTSKSITENELLGIAASLEEPSEHPLAEAILTKAKQKKLLIRQVENFQSIAGQGIEGRIDGKYYVAGNLKLMTDRKVNMLDFEALADKLADEGNTPLFIASEKSVLGVIAVADVLKPTSRKAIELFKKLGIEVVMLTGDHARTAAAIQAQLGIKTIIADVLPHEKDKEISRLQAEGKTVAMIGDGINDAPALTRADLGIAVGAGTDVAIESADIVLLRNDLLDAVTTLRLSKSVMLNIKQNLFWAFFYNIIGIPLAAGVFYTMLQWKLNPMFAAAAMSFSSVTVVLNALRLIRFKPNFDI